MTPHTFDASPDGSRKRYGKPRLDVYGDLGTVTRAITNMGQMDGAVGKAHGTRLPPGPGGSAG
jgi:hypothetical protein